MRSQEDLIFTVNDINTNDKKIRSRKLGLLGWLFGRSDPKNVDTRFPSGQKL